MRLRWLAWGFPVVAVAAGIACIPDPKGDYEEFIERTADQRTSPEGGGGGLSDAAVDSKPPTEAVKGTYVATCFTVLSSSADNVLRFFTETNYTPDGGGGGKLTMSMKPLKGYADGKATPPKCVCQSETSGATLNVKDAPVDAQGKFQVNMGKIDVPPEANGISGRPITLDPIVLTGRFASEKFCAELSGKVTQPISIELAPGDGKNICLFTPAKEGDTAPAFKEAEFVCK